MAVGIEDLAPAQLRDGIAALGARHWLLRPIALVADVAVLMVQGILLLFRNWRLVLLELVPAVWLATILWDWRVHVLRGESVVVVHGWADVAIVALILAATMIAYWCNVAFAFAATHSPPRVSWAMRQSTAAWPSIVGAALLVSTLHVTVSVGSVRAGWGFFSVGITIVVLVQMLMYTLLPARVLGLRSERMTVRDRIGKSILAATVALIASAPGFGLSRLGQLLLATRSLRWLGVVVLAIAVLVQVAGVSSTRAVSTTTTLLSRTGPRDNDS